ncbi:MAG: hypothetical protein JXM70_06250 [Pirellulales bacterium]|nr:hypothetical protein [Pirellulales bacterium]
MQTPDLPNDPYQPQQDMSNAGHYPQKPRQTTIPKTLGILNIVFGAVFMLIGAGTAIQYLMMPMFSEMIQAQQQQMTQQIDSQQKQAVQKLLEEQKASVSEDEKAEIQTKIDQKKNQSRMAPPDMAEMMGMKDRRVIIWGVINGFSGALLNIVMIISGVGLLLLKGWGRLLALWVAGLKILRLAASTAFYCFVCVPIIAQGMMGVMEKVGAQAGPAQQPPALEMGTMFAAMYWVQAIGFALVASIYPIVCLVLLTRPRVKAVFDNAPLTTPE